MSRFRSSIKNLSGVLGLESYHSYRHMSLEELEESIAEDDAEIQDTEGDIEVASDTMDELVEDQQTLTEVSETVDEAIESGEGLSEPAAAVVQEAVENIMRRHGMPRRTWPSFPSKEAYSSQAKRVEAAKRIKVSIEKGIFQKIKDGIKKIWESIKNFFNKIWTALTGKGKKTAQKAEEKEKELEEAKKEGEEVVEVDGSEAAAAAEGIVGIPDGPEPNDFNEDGLSATEQAIKSCTSMTQQQADELVNVQDAVTQAVEGNITVEEAEEIINKSGEEEKGREERKARRNEINATPIDVRIDRALNQVKTLKKAIRDFSAYGEKMDAKITKEIDQWITSVQGLMDKAKNSSDDTKMQKLLNIALAKVRGSKALIAKNHKAVADIADKILQGVKKKSKKKATINAKSSANAVKDLKFENSNRRFGSFKRRTSR